MDSEKIEISRSDIAEMIHATSTATAKYVLRELGLEKQTIQLSEIRTMYGRALAYRAELSSSLKWLMGGNRGKGIEKYTNRSEFEKWLFSVNK